MFIYVDLLGLEPFLEVVLLALEAVDQRMQLLGLLRQLARIETVDFERLYPLFEDRPLLGLQLFL